jgi:hypothetical protein
VQDSDTAQFDAGMRFDDVCYSQAAHYWTRVIFFGRISRVILVFNRHNMSCLQECKINAAEATIRHSKFEVHA